MSVGFSISFDTREEAEDFAVVLVNVFPHASLTVAVVDQPGVVGAFTVRVDGVVSDMLYGAMDGFAYGWAAFRSRAANPGIRPRPTR